MGLTSALASEMRQQTARAEQAERDLVLMTQRAEAAEADARVLLALVRTASIHYAARAVIMSEDNRSVAAIVAAYLDTLFEAAGDGGMFAASGCDPAAVRRAAESLGASTDDMPEVQP